MKAAVCLIFALAAAAPAAPADPGRAAVDFLEKVRDRRLDLQPGGDTALSPHTEAAKRERIARRLERLADDLGDAPLEIGAVKEDAGFAAVLVRKMGGYDPASLQVFPIALVKRGAEWLAAPVPASFENSGTAPIRGLRDRLTALEDWMLRRQVEDLQQLRDGAQGRMRRQIEERLGAETLQRLTARSVVERFLEATAARDLPGTLGLIGGLSAQPPDDWSQRLRKTERALANPPAAESSWRLLTDPKPLRAIVRAAEGGDRAEVTVGFLDPVGPDPEDPAATLQTVRLPLQKDAAGLWRIDPFSEPESDPRRPRQPDLPAADAFPAVWREAHPATPLPDPATAAAALEESLHHGDLASLLALVRLPEQPADARQAFIEAANFWQSFRTTGTIQRAIRLELLTEPGAAAALYQLFSTRDPSLFVPKTWLFEKTADGWQWSLRPATVLRQGFQQPLADAIARGRGAWQEKLLAPTAVITDLAGQPAPPEDAAVGCVEAWLAAVGENDLGAALGLMARSPDKRSETAALQNLGYEMDGARLRAGPPRVRGVYRDGPWTGVGVEIPKTTGTKVSHPFFPVVQTADGPRVLAGIDLFANGTHTRDYLNRNAFTLLEETAGKAAADSLRGLFERFAADLKAAPAEGVPAGPGN